jgi:mannose-6-phosphate isomerase
LTCKKALPLQIHPDKQVGGRWTCALEQQLIPVQLAEKLHREDPDSFADRNHKPEIAVALAPFQGFVGFRPLKQIVATLKHMNDLDAILPQAEREAFQREPRPETLKPLVASLLKLSTEEAKPVIGKIAARIRKEGDSALGEHVPRRTKVAEVLEKLESQYGGGACASSRDRAASARRSHQIPAFSRRRSS